MKRTILQMLDDAVTRWPDSPFVLRRTDAGWVPTSFRGARDEARQFAAWLLSAGYRKGDALAILGEGNPEWVVGELGLFMVGCISVPLSIKLLGEEVLFRLDHSEAGGILASRNQLAKTLTALKTTKRRDIRLVYLDADIEAARAAAVGSGLAADRVIGFGEALAAGRASLSSLAAEVDRLAASVEEDDTATISYTSGTTDNPRGIMLTQRNYWTNCVDARAAVPFQPGWRTLVVLPVDHSFAHTAALYTGLHSGFALYFVDSRGGPVGTLRALPVNLQEVRPDFLYTVPALSGSFMKKILAGIEEKGPFIERIFRNGIAAGIAWNGNGFDRPPLAVRLRSFFPYMLARTLVFGKVKKTVFGDSIRFCISGGATLDMKQQQFFAALGVPMLQGYGLTEASPIVSTNQPARCRFGTCGPVFHSVEVRIFGEDGLPMAKGGTGELLVRGPSVMKGYFKNPEATARTLRDGWLHTGDRANLDADGFLSVVGREKALLITEDGEKYSPEEIEEAVTFSTDVINQIMVYCDQRKYTSALVSLETGSVERLIKARGIKDGRALLAALSEEFFRFKTDPKALKVQTGWAPSVFQIVAEPFSDRDGTMNSTMKIVRRRIVEVHRDLLEYSYTHEGSMTDNPRNLSALKTLFNLGG